MRTRQVHDALQAFVEEAATRLRADAAGGEEVPFEVVETGGGRSTWRAGPTLYCYRPRTDRFIAQRVGVLGRLPSYLPAMHALASLGRLDAYLELRGERPPREPRARADAALLALLARVFEDAADFEADPLRVRRAIDEVTAVTEPTGPDVEVLVPLHGLELGSAEVALAGDLALVRADALGDERPDATHGPVPSAFAALRWEAPAGDDEVGGPEFHARVRLRRLLVALRLFDGAGVSAGPIAHTRTGAGPWQPFLLGIGGAPAGVCTVAPGQEDELRAFCSLVARRTPKRGPVAWALRRFELSCERPQPAEALTDVLLALRALLEPDGVAGSTHARLPARLAALCAEPEDREALEARVARATAQERSVVAGLAVDEDLDALALELHAHLRALLRDVLCGHLDPDLRALAEGLIAAADQPTLA